MIAKPSRPESVPSLGTPLPPDAVGAAHRTGGPADVISGALFQSVEFEPATR